MCSMPRMILATHLDKRDRQLFMNQLWLMNYFIYISSSTRSSPVLYMLMLCCKHAHLFKVGFFYFFLDDSITFGHKNYFFWSFLFSLFFCFLYQSQHVPQQLTQHLYLAHNAWIAQLAQCCRLDETTANNYKKTHRKKTKNTNLKYWPWQYYVD